MPLIFRGPVAFQGDVVAIEFNDNLAFLAYALNLLGLTTAHEDVELAATICPDCLVVHAVHARAGQ